MLKQLRDKKTAKKIWILLAIIILPAFVFWGFGSAVRSQREGEYAGKIFDKKITISEYKEALDAVKNHNLILFGDKFPEVQKLVNLEYQAWERLLLLYEAKKHHIKVNDQEVIALIESYPFFQRQGKFNNNAYVEIIRSYFHSLPRIFEEQTRENLMLNKLYQEITNAISITEDEVKKEYRKNNEEISINYIASLPSDFQKGITPSEQETKDFFAKNSLEFKQPISFNLEYVSFSSEDTIKSIMPRLSKKVGFDKVTKELGLPIKETGLFAQTDSIPGIGWAPEILGLLAKLKPGQFSPPIQMDKSYYILRLKERKEPYIPAFEMVKDKIKEVFIRKKTEEIARDKLEDCLGKLKEMYQTDPKSIDFSKVAKEYALKSDSTSSFKYGSYIEGIGASDIFWITATGLKDDEFSEIINIPSGFYIIKIKSRTPLDEKKLEEEKTEFTQTALSQKKQEYFTSFIDELKRKMQLF